MGSAGISQSQNLRRRAISAGAWSLVALVASQVIRLGGNLVMARLLMPEMFGIMVIATTVAVVLGLLSDIGLRQNIIQSARGDDPTFLNTAWAVQILRGLVLCFLSLCLAGLVWRGQVSGIWPVDSTYNAPLLPLVLAVTSISAIISGFGTTKVAVAFRSFQQKKLVIIEIAAQLIGLLLMLAIGYFTRSIWALVAAGLASALVSTALGHLWLRGVNNRWQWDASALAELVRFGRWMLVSSAIGVLAMQGDRILFGGSMSADELGVYSIAVLILGALDMGVQRLAGAVALPAFSEAARADDPAKLRALYYRFRLILDVLLLFACGFLLVVSPLIIGWLYDARYADAGRILAILSLSLFTLRFTLAHHVWLALGLTKYQAMDNFIRFFSLWTLLPLLLFFGGADYAVWGVALYSLPTLLLIVVVNKRLSFFDIKRELIVLPALGVGGVVGMCLSYMFD